MSTFSDFLTPTQLEQLSKKPKKDRTVVIDWAKITQDRSVTLSKTVSTSSNGVANNNKISASSTSNNNSPSTTSNVVTENISKPTATSSSSSTTVNDQQPYTLNFLFGVSSMQDLVSFARNELGSSEQRVGSGESSKSLLDSLAFFGDNELSHLVALHLWQKTSSKAKEPKDKLLALVARLNNKKTSTTTLSKKGQMTIEKSLYVCNQSLAAFLRRATILGDENSAAAKEMIDLFGVGADSNDHSWGTVFEALLWLASRKSPPLATVAVDRLVKWVDTNIDSVQKARLLENRDNDDDDNSIRVEIAREKLFPILVKRVVTPAPLSWKSLSDDLFRSKARPVSTSRVIASHNFDKTECEPRNCTIAGSFADGHNWHGCFCHDCRAMLVIRKVSNKHSEYFIVGPETCTQQRLTDWLDDYVDCYANGELSIPSQFRNSILADSLETWILFGAPRSHSDLNCQQCSALLSYRKCSIKHPCASRGCSNRSPCRQERHYCSNCNSGSWMKFDGFNRDYK